MGHGSRTTPREALNNPANCSLTPSSHPPSPVCFALPHYVPDLSDEQGTLVDVVFQKKGSAATFLKDKGGQKCRESADSCGRMGVDF